MNNSRSSRGPDYVALALIFSAAALRIALWLQQRSLWIDEARLSLNIASRSYLSLLPPLDYDQTAPLLYLFIERFTVAVFGVSETSLRFPSVIAGIATVALVYGTARKLFGRRTALLATGMCAVSPTLMHYSSEVKQYALEACVSCALLYLGLRWLEDPPSPGRWLSLVTLGVIAPWLAAPAPLVLASVGLAVVLTPRLAAYTRVRLTMHLLVWWGGSLALSYWWVYRHAAHDVYLRHYWSQAFLTPGRPGVMLDTGVALRGILWGPVYVLWGPSVGLGRPGDVAGAVFAPVVSIVIALIVVIGVRRLARATEVSGTILVTTPLILAFLASVIGVYPISARTTMYYMPALLILVAAGIEELAGQLRAPTLKRAVLVALFIPLTWIAIGELRESKPREDLRPLVASLEAQRRPGEPVYVFAGAIPAWAMYTTDWRSPDTVRLDYLRRIARAGGPAFENAPSRRRPVRDEGSGLTYPGPGGAELYGIPDGLEARAFGLTNPLPDEGWSENEARRIRGIANPGVWLIFSHFYGPEGILLHSLQAEGGQVTYQDLRNSAALMRYEFPRHD